VGRLPVHGLVDTGLIQSTRGYDPMMISHYKANWWNYKGEWPTTVQWPWQDWNKERLYKERILPWKELEKKGVPVHVGEWGCFNKTPHAVALQWMETQLELWKEAGWGWSLWNLRGSFGIMNSGREDITYEDYKGNKLDRKMLQLLMKYV
jgi:endoglucanase